MTATSKPRPAASATCSPDATRWLRPDPGRATVGPDGILRLGPHAWRCALGRGGIQPDKQEGDGATPAGLLPLRRVFYRADRAPPPPAACRSSRSRPRMAGATTRPTAPTTSGSGCPTTARHEHLWREDALYDLVGVLGWNDAPVMRGRGSAIFLHLARPDLGPTEGCIAPGRARPARGAGGGADGDRGPRRVAQIAGGARARTRDSALQTTRTSGAASLERKPLSRLPATRHFP